ncbi:Tyrosine recombinase XerC [Paraburkholderia domus]|nr:Tyrosine recombinase XerC [Paraburkholderia domus]
MSDQLPVPVPALLGALPATLEDIYADPVSRAVVQPGNNRAPRTACILGVDEDIPAILRWLKEFKPKDPPPAESPDEKKPKPRRRETYRSYRKEAERFYNWLRIYEGKDLASFTREDIDSYDAFLQAPPPHWCQKRYARREPGTFRPFEGPLSAKSRAQALVIIGALFSYLASGLYLAGNPFAVRRRKAAFDEHTEGDAVTRAAATQAVHDRFLPIPLVKLLLEILEQQALNAATQKSNAMATAERELFVVRFLTNTGLRREELAMARMSDVKSNYDLKSNTEYWFMNVLGKRNKLREVIVNDTARAALLRYRAAMGASQRFWNNTCPILLPLSGEKNEAKPLTDQMVYTIVKDALERAATAVGAINPEASARIGHASPHWFRHTFASTLDQLGVAMKTVQTQLGHNSIDTTAIYMASEKVDQARAMAKLAL